VAQAQQYIAEGYGWCVDFDLEKGLVNIPFGSEIQIRGVARTFKVSLAKGIAALEEKKVF